jgi:hypothetical protein
VQRFHATGAKGEGFTQKTQSKWIKLRSLRSLAFNAILKTVLQSSGKKVMEKEMYRKVRKGFTQRSQRFYSKREKVSRKARNGFTQRTQRFYQFMVQ